MRREDPRKFRNNDGKVRICDIHRNFPRGRGFLPRSDRIDDGRGGNVQKAYYHRRRVLSRRTGLRLLWHNPNIQCCTMANDVKSNVTSWAKTYAKDRWRHTRLPGRLAPTYVNNITKKRVTGFRLRPTLNRFTSVLTIWRWRKFYLLSFFGLWNLDCWILAKPTPFQIAVLIYCLVNRQDKARSARKRSWILKKIHNWVLKEINFLL